MREVSNFFTIIRSFNSFSWFRSLTYDVHHWSPLSLSKILATPLKLASLRPNITANFITDMRKILTGSIFSVSITYFVWLISPSYAITDRMPYTLITSKKHK